MGSYVQGCTCIIPCYNEESRILLVLQKLINLPDINAIIVVDDGSTDNTAVVVQKFCQTHQPLAVQLISYHNNKGKAEAVELGLREVHTSHVLLFDADLAHIKTEEVTYMIQSIQQYPDIDMGILRRISSSWYIKLFYRELILSGQRILKTKDLLNIFAKHTITKYQLEVAINYYMEQHNKHVVRFPFSADNTFKHLKRGFWYGWKRDICMFRDIFAYEGFWSFAKQILRFKPQAINTYKQLQTHHQR